MNNGYYSSAPVVLRYGPPEPPQADIRYLGRVLTVLAAVFGPPASVVTAFYAAITWSDCFIECSGNPDHLTGGLLWALAGALLLAAPVMAATLVRKASWFIVTALSPFVMALLAFGVLAH